MKNYLRSRDFPEQLLFEAAFNHASIGMALNGPDGRYLIANDALCRIFGYSLDELQALTWEEITYPDDKALDDYHYQRIISGETDHCRFEKRYFHKNGGVIWINLNAVLVRNDDGEPIFFIAQFEDITEKKTACDELARILEQAPDFIFRLNAAGRIILMNSLVERMFDVTRADLMGRTLAEIPERVRPTEFFIEKVNQALETGVEVAFDYAGVRTPGLFYQCFVKPEYEGPVRLSTFLVFIRDTTAKTLAERELNAILTGTPTVIARMTRDFRHLYINDAIEAETGIPAARFIGRTLAEAGIPETASKPIEKAIGEVFETGETIETEFDYDSPNGRRYYLARLKPERGPQGMSGTVLVFALDITKRKLAELDLNKAHEEVRRLRGLLPICSYCKNIRDDNDYWVTVENYVASHSEAQFSHSICPSCYETHIRPELDKLQKKKAKPSK
ncbi:MAG: PAS domain S-box protein [Acidobacteria bacterium]|nr:PAS domain S-box protein [Acidobacteriota bacterium]